MIRIGRWLPLWLAISASSAAAQPGAPAGQPPARPAPPVDISSGTLPPGHPPLGPADVMERARTNSAARGSTAGMGGSMRRALEAPAELGVSRPSAELPSGTIRVQVVDGAGRSLPGVPVRIGILVQGGARDARAGSTDASGFFVAEGLATGMGQAYRVSLTHQGATSAAMPFRLEVDRGQEVRLTRLEATNDDQRVLQVLGQAGIEIKEGRLHIVQHAQLANLGEQIYVFPEDGLFIALPAGFMAFESEQTMADHRLIPSEEGFHLRGSIPPGRVTISWSYDLPMDARILRLRLPMPFRTISYRVLSDAARGLELDVDGFGPTQTHSVDGREVLITELQRRPEDAPLTEVSITLRGLPTPGPLRWLALGAAMILGLFGLLALLRGGDGAAALAAAREARRDDLLEEAAELEALLSKGDVGPRYHSKRMEGILTELAAILRDQASTKPGPGSKAGGASNSGPRADEKRSIEAKR